MPDYQRIHIDVFDTLNLRVHTSVILSLSRQERYPHPPKQPEMEIFTPGLGAIPKFLKGAGASLLGLACWKTNMGMGENARPDHRFDIIYIYRVYFNFLTLTVNYWGTQFDPYPMESRRQALNFCEPPVDLVGLWDKKLGQWRVSSFDESGVWHWAGLTGQRF